MKTRFLESAAVCNICLSGIFIQGEINSCKHEFCFGCIERWAHTQNTCPVCIRRFNKIKQRPKRMTYNNTGKHIEIDVKTINQRSNYLSLVEYLVRIGLVEGRDFIIFRRYDEISNNSGHSVV